MNRITASVAVFVLLSAAPVHVQGAQGGTQQAPEPRASVAGEWTIYLQLSKAAMFRGQLAQDGAKLAGFMGNETAEFPVTGTIEGSQMKLTWSILEAGEEIKITVTGKFEREMLTGTAKIGELEDIEVNGQRTSKA